MVTKYNIGGSIMKSKAFENFIKDRCEEILENDSEYRKLIDEMLKHEKKLRTRLDKKQFEDVDKVISSFTSLISHAGRIIYKKCIEDVKIFKS